MYVHEGHLHRQYDMEMESNTKTLDIVLFKLKQYQRYLSKNVHDLSLKKSKKKKQNKKMNPVEYHVVYINIVNKDIIMVLIQIQI